MLGFVLGFVAAEGYIHMSAKRDGVVERNNYHQPKEYHGNHGPSFQ
jgi:hypothetical protein